MYLLYQISTQYDGRQADGPGRDSDTVKTRYRYKCSREIRVDLAQLTNSVVPGRWHQFGDGKGRPGPNDPKTYSSTSVRQIHLFLKMFTAFRLDLVTLA